MEGSVVSLGPADLAELRQLVDRYADAVDRRDGAALVDLFDTGGTVTVQADGGPVEASWTGAGVADLLHSLAGYPMTFHHVGGAVFEGEGEAAVGRVSCLAHHYQRTESGPVDLVMAVRYHDRYRRRSAGWRMSERRVAVQWTELHPAHPARRRS